MASDRWKRTAVKVFINFVLHLSVLCICHQYLTDATDPKYVFSSKDIIEIVDISCFVGFNRNRKSVLESVFANVQTAFSPESGVLIGYTDFDEIRTLVEAENENLNTETGDENNILIFHKRKKDRTCLATSTVRKSNPKVSIYSGNVLGEIVIDFVNQKCDTYRTKHGHLTIEGLHRQEILQTLFHIEQLSGVSMRKLFTDGSQQECTADSCSIQNNESVTSESIETSSDQKSERYKLHRNPLKMPACEKIPYPSKKDFFHNYLKISKPVIFTGAMENWPARTKWSNMFLKENYGEEQVHIKLTPSGEYEGIDRADQFENFNTFHIPGEVKQQLLFPDLVVVRPATANMKMSQFLDIVEQVANGTRTGFSAYLEYSSLAAIMPELEDDIEEMPFFENLLDLKHLNIWLSDGNTLGKLHFDPFDNFLCQISGRKEVILFEPHDNARLYEAHIPEAMLEYNQTTRAFSKKTLVDSTSMVMSPVDIRKPDFKRFPGLADTHPLNCTIDEGEVLYMPAFWWHEVQSYPNRQQGRNLAVNFWYDPFLVKEFPCQECKLDVNPKYRHLL